MKNYTDAFLSLLEDMARNPAVRVNDFYCTEGCEPELFERIERDFSVRLPAVVRGFYSQCNGASLKWSAETAGASGEEVSGRIRLLDLEKVFYGPEGARWEDDIWTNDMPQEVKQRRMELKPFDYFDPDDSGCCCFDLARPDISVDLMLHSVDYGLNNITCDFPQYLDYLLKTRGLIRWQYLFVPTVRLPGHAEHEQFVRETLKTLFGETLP